jgi:hypothetical protein
LKEFLRPVKSYLEIVIVLGVFKMGKILRGALFICLIVEMIEIGMYKGQN